MTTILKHHSLQYINGVLHLEGVSLERAAKKLQTPAFLYSEKSFTQNILRFQKGLSEVPHMICFAAKANSNLSILKLGHSLGMGVDIVSGGELFRAQKAGVPPKKIVFSGVGKTEAEMQMALSDRSQGVHSFNVESIEELETLHRIAKKLNKIATVALRFNPNVDAKTHPHISTGLKRNKFGLNKNEILKILVGRKKYSWIRFEGISIHIGSQITSLRPLEDAFKKTRQLAQKINLILEKPLKFVDLGGGLGIPYRQSDRIDPKILIDRYCRLIKKIFGSLEQKKLGLNLKIFIEPGRIISGNSGILLTRVLYRKARPSKDFLVVDASMSELIRPALYDGYHEIFPIRRALQKTSLHNTEVVGPVCESADFLGKNRMLSRKIKKDDLLAVLSCGAYGFVMSNQYNSRPRSPEALIRENQIKVIKKRETYKDLIQSE